MDEYFAATPITNATVLCVGGITRAETEAARENGLKLDGSGYYLFLASEASPENPIEILATVVSEDAAARLAVLFDSKAA